MNISEGNSVSRLLRWLTGDKDVTAEQAREHAAWLAGRAHRALCAGITPEQVDQRWLRPTPTDTVAVPAETLGRIARSIDRWLDGELPPHDALTEIHKEVGDR